MTAEAVCEIADCAVNKAMARSRHLWRPEDREDARQEAIVEILKVSQTRTYSGNGYLFRTALLQVYLWMRNLIRRNRTFLLSARFDGCTNVDSAPVEQLLISVGGLKQLLREQRSYTTRLTDRNVEREIEYLRLLLQGYTYEEIAFRMAVTRKATWMLHDCLVERLTRIAAGVKTPPRVIPPPKASSLKALEKVRLDPEKRALRTAKLRQTLSAPEVREQWRETARKNWTDPQMRERQRIGVRAWAAKRKAASTA